ncbi:signal recognition particle receptor beta subunit-domain-containing protein [Crepidotus variabilis]|uniref:Signal recognition particle receptor subunit beta n=1 Tax=Crepidotus variabilis TaxID=179855 RepID=A0A9P6JSQ3_9AGAR|nr:signal recognition particle receptor beta subunit-domain-containing protein [Crepidotus variabilis]
MNAMTDIPSQGSEGPEVIPVTAMFNPQIMMAGSALVALLLISFIFLLTRRRTSSKGTALLLVGPPDAGKTSVMSQTAFGQPWQTQTSMQINMSAVTLSPKKMFPVIDIPGHPRLRGQFTEHLPSSKAVAFVVDSSTISRNAAAVAEHLHLVLHALTSLPPSQHQPALLILAHKSDLLKATASSQNTHTLAINRVKTILERELEKRRASQSGGINIEGLGDEGESTELGGLQCGEKEGASFKFDEWEGGEIIFLGTSVLQNGSAKEGSSNGLESLQQWLQDNM